MTIQAERITTESDREVTAASRAVRAAALPLTGAPGDHDGLMELVGESRIVLIGESSHGTHDFYAQRAAITKRLIEEKGFRGVAVEGDWPDSWQVNRYVRGLVAHDDPLKALAGFRRFPTWMWRNTVVLEFIAWLRDGNSRITEPARRCGFYGLDLYSLFESIDSVIAYLEHEDPAAAERARSRYACFEAFGGASVRYGRDVSLGVSEPCRRGAVEQLVELQKLASSHLRLDGFDREDEFLHAEINARTVGDAEEYYRSMFSDPHGSWNLRDRHMADTLDRLLAHLETPDGDAGKVVVWAHNSHVGDSRATEMGDRGELTVGRLARERYGSDAVLIGMTTHHGSVTASTDWGMPGLRRKVRPAIDGSIEHLMHSAGLPAFTVIPSRGSHLGQRLSQHRLERAIGVVYRPQTERESHYRWARAADEFDAILHIDETRALEPLERTSEWQGGEPPETFPTAL